MSNSPPPQRRRLDPAASTSSDASSPPVVPEDLNRLLAHIQQLEQENSRLQQLEQENSRLQQLKQENSRLQQENNLLEQRLIQERKEREKEAAMAETSAFSFAHFKGLFKTGTPLEIPYERASEDEIMRAWRAVQRRRGLVDPFQGSDENRDLHPLMGRLVETIWKAWGISSFVFTERRTMRNPHIQPGGCISVVPTPNWPDALFVLEAKLPKGNDPGILQAFRYLYFVENSLSTLERAHRSRIGIFLDYESIVVLWFQDGDLSEPMWSDRQELLPPGWRQKDKPTAGFTWLCHALKMPPPEVESVKLGNGVVCGVESTLSRRSDDFVVFGITFRGVPYAVKAATRKTKILLQLLVSEFHYAMSELRKSEPLRPYLLEADPVLSDLDNGIVVMPLGETLLDWYDRNVNVNDPVDTWWPECKRLFLQVVDVLRKLHKSGFMHCDIRPLNILVVNGGIRLIDWTTLCRVNELPNFFLRQGVNDPFMVDDLLLEAEGSMLPVAYFYPKWDLASFAFTILGMHGDFHRMRMPKEDSNFVEARAAAVKHVFDKPNADPVVRFAQCLLLNGAETMSNNYQDVEYDQLVNLLNGID